VFSLVELTSSKRWRSVIRFQIDSLSTICSVRRRGRGSPQGILNYQCFLGSHNINHTFAPVNSAFSNQRSADVALTVCSTRARLSGTAACQSFITHSLCPRIRRLCIESGRSDIATRSRNLWTSVPSAPSLRTIGSAMIRSACQHIGLSSAIIGPESPGFLIDRDERR
jgi:hypothetical protein